MRTLLTLFICLLGGIVTAQDQHFVPKEKWNKNLYISDEFCKSKGLEPGETNNLLRAWNNLQDGAAFTRVVDIRWYFSSPEEAAKYLTDHKEELSEKGDIAIPMYKIPFAENLKLFYDGAVFTKMNEALGLKSHMYIFLFTEKNYLAKVFVSTEKDIKSDEAAVFAIEAAKRLHASL